MCPWRMWASHSGYEHWRRSLQASEKCTPLSACELHLWVAKASWGGSQPRLLSKPAVGQPPKPTRVLGSVFSSFSLKLMLGVHKPCEKRLLEYGEKQSGTKADRSVWSITSERLQHVWVQRWMSWAAFPSLYALLWSSVRKCWSRTRESWESVSLKLPVYRLREQFPWMGHHPGGCREGSIGPKEWSQPAKASGTEWVLRQPCPALLRCTGMPASHRP